jgi:hypothetical protein
LKNLNRPVYAQPFDNIITHQSKPHTAAIPPDHTDILKPYSKPIPISPPPPNINAKGAKQALFMLGGASNDPVNFISKIQTLKQVLHKIHLGSRNQ